MKLAVLVVASAITMCVFAVEPPPSPPIASPLAPPVPIAPAIAGLAPQGNFFTPCDFNFIMLETQILSEGDMIRRMQISVLFQRSKCGTNNVCKAEADAVLDAYRRALVHLAKAEAYAELAYQSWAEMVATANANNVGLPGQRLPIGVRLKLVKLGIQTRWRLHRCKVKVIDALIEEAFVYYQLLHIHWPALNEQARAIMFQNDLTRFAVVETSACVNPQLDAILTIAIANLRARFNLNQPNGNNGGGNGGNNGNGFAGNNVAAALDRLSSHPSFGSQTDLINMATAPRTESGGLVHRMMTIGFEIPAGGVLEEDLVEPDGTILAYAGDTLAVESRELPTLGMFRQRGNKLESYGNPLTLRYQPDADDDLVIQCWADHAPTLLAGQTDGCGISLDVTGSPADIAAGKKATRDIVIHGLGGGDFGFMKFFVTLEAPLEAPENPCYVWNPATSSYELDHSIPGCSSGSPGGGQASLLNERRLLLPNAATGLEPSPDPISVAKAGQFPSIPTIEVGEAAEE